MATPRSHTHRSPYSARRTPSPEYRASRVIIEHLDDEDEDDLFPFSLLSRDILEALLALTTQDVRLWCD